MDKNVCTDATKGFPFALECLDQAAFWTSGNGDFPLLRPNGVIDFDARYLLEADDGAVIYMQNRGYRWGSEEAMAKMSRNEPVGPGEYYMRVSPKFDAPEGPHEWMSRHVFVGVAEKIPGANRIHYFVVL